VRQVKPTGKDAPILIPTLEVFNTATGSTTLLYPSSLQVHLPSMGDRFGE
jgi:hypothetical protein